MFWLGETKSGGDLFSSCAPDETRHLSMAVDRYERGARKCVEEVDTTIVTSASSGKEGRLPWRESEGFHSGVEREDVLLLRWHYGEDFTLPSNRGVTGA